MRKEFIASYYVLFAIIGGSARTLVIEIAVASGFLALGVVGFKTSLWLISAAMIAHGVFDCIHASLIQNPGVPSWWPGFCLAFDVFLGGWLSLLLLRRSHPALTTTSK